MSETTRSYDQIQRDPDDPVQVVPAMPVVDDANPEGSSLALSKHRTKLSTHRTYLSEHRTGLSERRSEMSSRRTGMSFQRTRMSADRTLMSVIRTSLSLISFGFTIYQVFRGMQRSNVLPAGANPASFLGQALVYLGVGMIAFGILYHLRFMGQLRRERSDMMDKGYVHADSTFPISLTVIVAICLLIVGAAAIASIVFHWPI